MKTLILTLRLLALLSNFSLATPYSAGHKLDGRDNSCLTEQEATAIVDKWRSLFTNFNETVSNKTLTVDFHEFSDSQNSVSPGSVPGQAIASSRAEFNAQQLAAQGSPQAITEVTITPKNIVYGCQKISFRWDWHGTFALNGPIVTPSFSTTDKKGDVIDYHGIDFLVLKPGTRLIQTAYSEFDGIGFLFQFGLYVCFQKNNQTHCAP